MSVMNALRMCRGASKIDLLQTSGGNGLFDNSKVSLANSLPPELAAKFEKHAREARAKAKDQSVGPPVTRGKTDPEDGEMRRSFSRGPRSLARDAELEEADRLYRLQYPPMDSVHLHSSPATMNGHRSQSHAPQVRNLELQPAPHMRTLSTSPRGVSPRIRNGGRSRLRTREHYDRAQEEKGKRQMYDKRTLRRRHANDFRTAVQHWRQQHVERGGRPRRAQAVHVAVRVRPMFDKEAQNGEFEVVTVYEDWGEIVVHNCLLHADLVRMFVLHNGYCFPRTYTAEADNLAVYAECGSPLVKHALHGELGTLFMFGQTGSGKTYTMSAIMDLAASEIFANLGADDIDDGACTLMCFEVAGKKCFDLLPKQRAELKLLDDKMGRTNIIGAEEVTIRGAEECIKKIGEALARRATAGHARNDESSRSHCVCVLDLQEFRGGKLILVDCAGTERRQDSDHHTQERMRESAEINSSLHALKECIRYRCKEQRAARQEQRDDDDDHRAVHVPYRDSQLTRVLHESFTRPRSMLGCIGCASPTAMDTEHTLSTLKTLQLLLSESGNGDAPNFEQKVDVDAKTMTKDLKALGLKRSNSGNFETPAGMPGQRNEKSLSERVAERYAESQPREAQPRAQLQTQEARDADSEYETPPRSREVERPSGRKSLFAKAISLAAGSTSHKEVRQALYRSASTPLDVTPPRAREAPVTPATPSTGVREGRQSFDTALSRPSLGGSPEQAAAQAAASELIQAGAREEALRQDVIKLKARLASTEEQLRSKSSSDSAAEADLQDRASKAERRADDLLLRVQELEVKNAQLDNLFRQEQDARRKCHNQLLDLKGQIRVFCRIRPPLPREGEDVAARRLDGMSLEVVRCSETLQGAEKREKRVSQFDAIFGPSASQEEVYREVEDLVQSAADGYNVTVFAYGQTGAGKTHTMYGGSSGHARGLAPRTSESIFAVLERFDKQRFRYEVRANLVELYRNDLYDLLVPVRGSVKLEVRKDPRTGGSSIEGAQDRQVTNAEQLMLLLEEGTERRSTASTQMNADSSRSHLFLSITIEVSDLETRGTISGKIRLCDLAGSERLGKSGATGDQMAEAIAINKSLTALGDVIESLTRGGGKGNVPYRNHKLTQLLSDSIGGTAKTLMFVNISPARSEVEETLSSLSYATRARSIVNDVQRPGVKIRNCGRSASEAPPALRLRSGSMTMEDLDDVTLRKLSEAQVP